MILIGWLLKTGNFVYHYLGCHFIGHCLIPLDPCILLKVRAKSPYLLKHCDIHIGIF